MVIFNLIMFSALVAVLISPILFLIEGYLEQKTKVSKNIRDSILCLAMIILAITIATQLSKLSCNFIAQSNLLMPQKVQG